MQGVVAGGKNLSFAGARLLACGGACGRLWSRTWLPAPPGALGRRAGHLRHRQCGAGCLCSDRCRARCVAHGAACGPVWAATPPCGARCCSACKCLHHVLLHRACSSCSGSARVTSDLVARVSVTRSANSSKSHYTHVSSAPAVATTALRARPEGRAAVAGAKRRAQESLTASCAQKVAAARGSCTAL